MNAIEIVTLRQGYPRMSVFSDFTLTIPQGVTGLLGPNGAGKTTLLETIATIRTPQGGAVRIGGEDTRTRAQRRTARRQIGFLPQRFGYFPGFTITEFVTYCAWLREVPRPNMAAAVDDAIAAVGLSDRAGMKMSQLSGGQRQRAGIAQAIVGGPTVVLLDEPTVGLDPMQRIDFRDLIRSLPERVGATVVLSTHLAEDVDAVCDRVCVIAEGRRLFTGSPKKLAAAADSGARGDNPIERGYASVLARSTT